MMDSKNNRAVFSTLAALALPALLLAPVLAGAQTDAGASTAKACNAQEQTSYPKVLISNGAVNAVVYLPDAKNGYYRSTRFDWSGVVGCLSYKGHNYFGQWFPHYNPMISDAITGPVEEFRSSEGALLYNEAKPGELFVKPGVGVLRRVDNSPYEYPTTYPLIDPGKWKVKTSHSGVVFTQHLQSKLGIAYVYTKNLRLDKKAPVLLLEHALKNTGKKTIETDVYDHDFFMLDGTPTGPDISVHFGFVPQAVKPLQHGGTISGNELTYERELQPRESVFSFLTGFSDKVSDYDMKVENRKTGAGVEQTSDSPISNFNFWSIRTTVCPEAYIHLSIPPGHTAHWTIRYRFYTK
jgi:hypothetical protein